LSRIKTQALADVARRAAEAEDAGARAAYELVGALHHERRREPWQHEAADLETGFVPTLAVDMQRASGDS